MSKLMVGALALVTAMIFAGGNVAFSAEGTPSQHHAQAQMTPDTGTKSEAAGKRGQAKTKKAKKTNKAKKSRKPVQQAN